MKIFFLISFLFFNLACTRLQTLNLKPHYYSQRPSNIIWIQLAGFTDQHLPLLRFDNTNAEHRTQFESADCLGKMWSFNLFELRPSASLSFLSQVTGSKNIKGSCDDLSRRTVWGYLEEEGYTTSILESGATGDESLEKFLTCGDIQKNNMKAAKLVRMGPEAKEGVASFHYQDPQNVSHALSYDKSCQKGVCYASLFNNAQKIMANITSGGSSGVHNFYLLRDFTYLKALRKKDLAYAKEVLGDLEKLLTWVDSQKRNDILILVTGAEGLELDFPKEGKEWADFVRSGKNFTVNNSTLLSTVFARGPMAENFCGLFDETEMIKRVLYKPSRKQFSWDAVNPFGN